MKKLLIGICYLGTSMGWSQVNQYWLDVTLNNEISEKITWVMDGGPRFHPLIGLNTIFFRSYVDFKIGKVIPSVGAAYFYSKTESGIEGHESRLWQGIKWNPQLTSRITFQNLARIEERWIYTQLARDFFFRFRYQTGLSFLLYQNKEKRRSFSIPISYELFDDLNKKNFINRDRFDIGIGYRFGSYKIEGHYLYQENRKSPLERFDHTEDIFRLRWFFYII